MAIDDEFHRLARALGSALSDGRRRRGWTQEELAELCEVTPGYIARLERGERLPSPLLLDTVARSLGLQVAEVWPRAAVPTAKVSASSHGGLRGPSDRDTAIARLVKVVEGLTPSEIRQVATTVQRLLRAGTRRKDRAGKP